MITGISRFDSIRFEKRKNSTELSLVLKLMFSFMRINFYLEEQVEVEVVYIQIVRFFSFLFFSDCYYIPYNLIVIDFDSL